MQRAYRGLIRSGQSLSHINVLDLRQNMNINSDGSLISQPSDSGGARIAGGRGSNNRVTVDLLTSQYSELSLPPLSSANCVSQLTSRHVSPQHHQTPDHHILTVTSPLVSLENNKTNINYWTTGPARTSRAPGK